MMGLIDKLRAKASDLLDVPEAISSERYSKLRTKIIVLMVVTTVLPILVLSFINYYQYQATLARELVTPLRALVNKTKHSFELYLAERASTVGLLTNLYSFRELQDEKTLNRVFKALRTEAPGFVDLGLIDENGQQVSYVGPYNLKGVNYAEQAWFQRARIKGVYVSEVFMGFRKFPHVAIAVQRIADDGTAWIVRATIDTDQFDRLIAAMGLDPESDAFLVNAQGALQTASRFHGAILEKAPWQIPASGYEPGAFDARDPQGRDVIVAHAALVNADFTLVAVKPRAEVFRPWTTFRGELFLLFGGSTLFIVTVVALLVDVLIRRMRESDEKRVAAFARMEHANKLSSIGRLAAGVAHEINNPLAIIFEKAGLMQDVLGLTEDFPQKDRFLKLVAAVVRSVERCRSITHRLLGFSRRMDESFEPLDVNDALAETLGFLEKEAANRDIVVDLDLEPGLPRVVSDRGQMQQVFLNILNNAFAAVPDGGRVEVSTARQDQHLGGLGGLGETVTVTIADNGKGMSPEILEHIFEPFYSTKGAMGTGLGMFITYGIIKRLGGDILVDSAEGRGTRVRVLLPVNAQAPLPEAV